MLGALLALTCGVPVVAEAATAPLKTAATMLPEPVAPVTVDAARAAAPRPGSGGWYWPIGTEDFNGWSGWLEPRGSYVHVAQDMPSSAGHDVYAIGDGTVFISRADAGGYGVGGSPGGCVIIVHTTAAGQEFRALYGHVSDLRFKAGEKVQAGDVIARVNGCRHLHFSIHPSAKYRDGNPYAGHVPKSWADHGGFVDPVEFLKTNPAAADYVPPALPCVEIATSSPPLRYGAAAGVAYWTEEGAAASVTYRDDLATRERRALAPGEVVPSFDAARYTTASLVAPAQGFSVGDHLPVLQLTTGHATPEWRAAVRLKATLRNAAGSPLEGAVVRLDRLHGETWVRQRLVVTDVSGRAAIDFTPARRGTLRLVFVPPSDQPAGRDYLGARSRAITVTPHADVAPPRVRATVRAGDSITVAGYVTPRHPKGESSVELHFQRRGAGGAWVPKLTVQTTDRDAPAGRSRYVGSVRLPAAGAWRVQAVHPADEDHAHSYSRWRAFTVK